MKKKIRQMKGLALLLAGLLVVLTGCATDVGTFSGTEGSVGESNTEMTGDTGTEEGVSQTGSEAGAGEEDGTSYAWKQIIASVNDGSYREKYQIGDTLELDFGAEGIVEMQIAAFDADELADGSGTAAITLISKQLLNTEHRMNPDVEGSSSSGYTLGTGGIGGWKESEMRTWLQNDVKSLIPAAIRDSIKQVKKYSTSFDTSNNKVENELTYDDLWIPSVREIFGDTYSYYESTGPAYTDLFASSTDRLKCHFDTSDGSWWWLRSADHNSSFYDEHSDGGGSNGFVYISHFGDHIDADLAGDEEGVALGFCL